jgi:hypothetical protein
MTMPSPEKFITEVEKAVKMRPDSLLSVSAVFLTAALIHHRALARQVQARLENIQECGCPDCLCAIPNGVGTYGAIIADTVKLMSLLNGLQEINGWKPPEKKYVHEMMKDISGVLNAEYLEQLYRREDRC